MRSLRFIFITLTTFLFVTSAVFWRRAIAIFLNGINKLGKLMRQTRFWLLGIVSFIIATVATVCVSGSFLNRLLLAASCTVFSFNSTFCTPDLGVESDRAVAFESFRTDTKGHRGITQDALKENRISLKGSKGDKFSFTDKAGEEVERANRGVDLKSEYLDSTSISNGVMNTLEGLSDMELIDQAINGFSDPNELFALLFDIYNGDDIVFSDSFYQPTFHFDRETFQEGSRGLMNRKEDALKELRPIKDANDEDAKLRGRQARKYLGQALHTLQDFYAHSNWVELAILRTKFEQVLSLKP